MWLLTMWSWTRYPNMGLLQKEHGPWFERSGVGARQEQGKKKSLWNSISDWIDPHDLGNQPELDLHGLCLWLVFLGSRKIYRQCIPVVLGVTNSGHIYGLTAPRMVFVAMIYTGCRGAVSPTRRDERTTDSTRFWAWRVWKMAMGTTPVGKSRMWRLWEAVHDTSQTSRTSPTCAAWAPYIWLLWSQPQQVFTKKSSSWYCM